MSGENINYSIVKFKDALPEMPRQFVIIPMNWINFNEDESTDVLYLSPPYNDDDHELILSFVKKKVNLLHPGSDILY